MSAGAAVSGAAQGAATGAVLGTAVPVVGNIAGAVIGGVAGLIGGLFSGGDTDKANALLQQAYQEILNTGAPPDESKAIILNKFQQAGMYTPQLEQAVNVGVSKVAAMQENPQDRQNQLAALQQIQQRAGGGLTASDRAAFNQEALAAQRDAEGKRQQIIQNMQARGQGGSGSELQAALLGSQAGADSEAASGDRVAAAASQNALAAAGQAGQLSGQVRGQDYQAQLQKAQAADELNRFNVQGQMQRQSQNVAAQNQAGLFNTQNAQNVANQNTAAANNELDRQAQAAQQYWQSKLNYSQAQASALAGQANAAMGQAAQSNQAFANTMGGIGNLATNYQNNQNTQALLNRLVPPGNSSGSSTPDQTIGQYGMQAGPQTQAGTSESGYQGD